MERPVPRTVLALNLFSARAFGESEFWFAGIKVVTIIVFLVLGTAMIVGLIGGHEAGLTNWTIGEAPFVKGWSGTFSVLMAAGFAFVGVESAAVAAGEAENPRQTMPRAINSVFIRIMLFHIGAIVVVATLMAYTWFYNATGLTGFIAWTGVCLAHLRFRAAWRAQGRGERDLPYRARFFPVGTWFALVVFVGVIIGQGAALIMSDSGFTWYGLLAAYIGLPIAVAL